MANELKRFKTELLPVSKIKNNPNNPRVIKDDKFRKLVKSIKEFPEMMEIRPIVVNDELIALGGNMRLKACKEAGLTEVPVIKAKNLTEGQQREFIIKDNVGFGEWDWDEIANKWDTEKLDEWGLDVPEMTETEKLSKIDFEDIYYNPNENPVLNLIDCVNLDKFKQKLNVINESNLSEEQKEVLKFFAYRFIKIDFQDVADYYFFNAQEDEQKVIERLRLVLCDSGIKGFIDDDLLRVHDLIQDWSDG